MIAYGAAVTPSPKVAHDVLAATMEADSTKESRNRKGFYLAQHLG